MDSGSRSKETRLALSVTGRVFLSGAVHTLELISTHRARNLPQSSELDGHARLLPVKCWQRKAWGRADSVLDNALPSPTKSPASGERSGFLGWTAHGGCRYASGKNDSISMHSLGYGPAQRLVASRTTSKPIVSDDGNPLQRYSRVRAATIRAEAGMKELLLRTQPGEHRFPEEVIQELLDILDTDETHVCARKGAGQYWQPTTRARCGVLYRSRCGTRSAQ